MDTKKLVLLGKIFNIFEIVLAAVMLFGIKICNMYIEKANNSVNMEDYLRGMEYVDHAKTLCTVIAILSIITIAVAVYLFIASKGSVSMLAIGLLLLSGVLTCVFGFVQFVHVYLVILPAGYSLRLFAETPIQNGQPQNGFVNQ